MRRIACFQVSFLVAATLTACSGGSPSSPSDFSSSRATISGTAVVGSGAGVSGQRSGLTASTSGALASVPAGLRVCVEGTEICVDVTDSGTFQVSGDLVGDVELHFVGPGQNVVLIVHDVQAGQTIVVSVSLNGTHGSLQEESRLNGASGSRVEMCHVTGNGSYHLIEVDESARAAHLRHGDGLPGDEVPSDPNLTFGEDCELIGPAVDIEKSTNGHDADATPGPVVPVGEPVVWSYEVTNIGDTPLMNVSVMDSVEGPVDCPATSLDPGASMVCTAEDTAGPGQYSNTGTVTADFLTAELGAGTVEDSDESHYLGEDETDGSEDRAEKVRLCHLTGNGSYREIEVSVNAVPAHMAHGDQLPVNGSCPAPDPS